jgi:hypothetical protein
MIEQAEALEDSDVQDRIAALLESEEDNPEEEVRQDEDQETDETAETIEEAEEETLELTWNGETKALKKSEVVELAQKGYDYTTKTQQLAEQRKTLEAQAQQFQHQVAIQTQLADKFAEIKALDNQLAQYRAVDWQSLAQSDPMQYLSLNQTYSALKEQKNEMVVEYQRNAQQLTQAQQAQREQVLAREARLMQEAIPELRGEKAQQTQAELRSYLASTGFNDDEIGSIMDHRMIKVAVDAMKFAKLKSAQPEVKKRMAEAPKVVKGKQPAPNNAVRELRERAKRGDEKAIVALIERTL